MPPFAFDPKAIIPAFDLFLENAGLSYEAVIVGGAALSFGSEKPRLTHDVDIFSFPLPWRIKIIAQAFAAERGLSSDWLDSSSAGLAFVLPEDWRSKVELVFEGRALRLYTLCRLYLIYSKFWAFCGRGSDLKDLLEMNLSEEEKASTRTWALSLQSDAEWGVKVDDALVRI